MNSNTLRKEDGGPTAAFLKQMIYARADQMTRRVTRAAEDLGRAHAAERDGAQSARPKAESSDCCRV